MKKLWGLFSLILIIAALMLTVVYVRLSQELESIEETLMFAEATVTRLQTRETQLENQIIQTDALRVQVDQAYQQIVEENLYLLEQIENLESDAHNNALAALSDFDRQWLMDRYALTPETLSEDLKTKPEVIEMEPVLGGTMYFYEVHLLNRAYAYGKFEDGHIVGFGFFNFEVTASGDITWTSVMEVNE